MSPQLVMLAFLLAWGPCAEEESITKDSGRATLAERWSGALKQHRGKEFWLGYSIRKQMKKNDWIGNVGDESSPHSLHEEIYGIPPPDKPSAHFSSSGGPGMMTKEVAILICYDKKGLATELTVSNLSLRVDRDGKPLVWFGVAEEGASIGLLRLLWEKEASGEMREAMVSAIGAHDRSADSFRFLKEILIGKDAPEVREQSAFWIGQQNGAEGLELLSKTARSDRSTSVAEHAIFSMSQMSVTGALDSLIALARGPIDPTVREKAIFWLGQEAGEKSGATLKDLAWDDEEVEVQKQAIFALTQAGEQSIPELIKIAKTHPHKEIRKQSIFWLSQLTDQRAFDTLVEIVKGK